MHKTFFHAFFGFLALGTAVTACDDGPVVPVGETSAGAGAGTAGGAGAGAVAGAGGTTGGAAGSTGGTMTSTGGSGGTSMGSGGTAGAGVVYSYCTKPCGTVKDCCPAGAMGCPGETYPNNYQCQNSACRSAECASTTDCATLDPMQDCFALSGLNTCVTPCATDGDCKSPATCSGKDDNGKKYCSASGAGCANDAACSGFGKCVNKLCVCSKDADCTAAGFNKCAL